MDISSSFAFQTLNTPLRLIGFLFHQNKKINSQPTESKSFEEREEDYKEGLISLSLQPKTKVPLSKNINYCSIVSTMIFRLKHEGKILVVYELITVR